VRHPPITGQQLQDAIVDCAHTFGWIAAHFRPARTAKGYRTPVQYDGAGFPDLVLVRDRVVFSEIKGTGDSLRDDQREWLAALEAAGAETYVWSPAEWRSGEVEAVLRRAEGIGG
jgi:hypothetical protein